MGRSRAHPLYGLGLVLAGPNCQQFHADGRARADSGPAIYGTKWCLDRLLSLVAWRRKTKAHPEKSGFRVRVNLVA